MSNLDQLVETAYFYFTLKCSHYVDSLTERQKQAWIYKSDVPKSPAHQKRYRDYLLAKSEYEVLKRRSQFRIVS